MTFKLQTRVPTGRVPWPLILIEGSEKAGKAQPLHSLIATPSGWTTMGEVMPGDQVIGANGGPTTVTAVHERGERSIYRLTFSDGAVVEACDEHLWATQTSSSLHSRYNKGPKKGQRNQRPDTIRTTADIRGLVLSGTVVHVPIAGAVEYAGAGRLPLDAYALGLLLGDGGLTKPSYPSFTSGDPELLDALAAALPEGDLLTRSSAIQAGIKGGITTAILRTFGLMGTGSADKFIPESYMWASVADRLALLQGLLDTDGGMESKSITFTSVSPVMASQVQEIVRSLGGTCSMTTKQPFYRDAAGNKVECKTAYRLSLRLPVGMCPFRLSRKVESWEAVRPTFHTPPRRTVKSVDYIGEMPARCITVDADDHLYLTDGFVVTHNSWSCAELSASPKVGQTYWIDLGEGGADEYGAIPGARYLVVEHDGSFGQVLAAVEAIKIEAQRVADSGEPPVVLVIDSMTAEWDLLKGIADSKARQRLAKRGRAVAADAEPQISMDLWNEANTRHRKLMTALMTFPGIVAVTARGKEVAALDSNGRPVEGSKEYKVEGQKNLAFDATVWIRVSRDHPPMVVGARSVNAGVRPGVDKPKPAPGLTLEKVVFDILRCNPSETTARDMAPASTAEPESPRFTALMLAVESAPDVKALKTHWLQIEPAVAAGEITAEESARANVAVSARKAALEAAASSEESTPAPVEAAV